MMLLPVNALSYDELVVYRLRELYKSFGYTQYKVGKFEEYDLYAHNKSFLVSENVLTFTDTDGKLMALKPDVTLSIVKNAMSDAKATSKLYYNENVYRTSSESNGFKEIVQTGLECIGKIDTFSQGEVIALAAKSLEQISEEYILDISHMGLIEGMLDVCDIEDKDRASVTALVKSKNVSSIKNLFADRGYDPAIADAVCELTLMYKTLRESVSQIERYVRGEKMRQAFDDLCAICDIMDEYGLSEKLYFDFSIVNDCNYYDGIIFKGFISGVPDSILSGGRYDRLLQRIGKDAGAIGFAVYLDRLERFCTEDAEYDVDVLLVYDADADTKTVINTAKTLMSEGESVRVALDGECSIRARRVLRV